MKKATKPRLQGDTRERLLQTGIRMFARDGVGNVSLRQVTKAARVNTALMHYHFGSKTAFFDAVVARCIKPINDERLRQLAEIERRAGKGGPDLAALIRAWAAPLLLQEVATHEPAMIIRLYADIAAQADPKIRKATEDYSRDAIASFVAAFRRALPGLPGDEAAWRFFYLVAALRMTCSDPYFIERITSHRWTMNNTGRFLDHLVGSLSLVLATPQPKRAPGKKRS